MVSTEYLQILAETKITNGWDFAVYLVGAIVFCFVIWVLFHPHQ